MVNQLMGLGISLLAIELANSWGTLIISYPQLMGVRSYTGLQSTFTSIVPSKNLNSLSSGGRPLAERGSKYTREACHEGDHTTYTQRACQQYCINQPHISGNASNAKAGHRAAAYRQKSSKSHDSLFKKWVDWCNQWHSDPVQVLQARWLTSLDTCSRKVTNTAP